MVSDNTLLCAVGFAMITTIMFFLYVKYIDKDFI